MVNGKPGPEGSSGIVFENQAYLQFLSNLSRQGPPADSFLSHKSTNHKTHTKPTLNYTLKNAKGDPGSPALQADALPPEPPGKPFKERCCRRVASVVSNSVRPHRWRPTRLRLPWDSPGKNTGVGCHFLLQCMKEKSESEVAQLCPTLSDLMDCSLPGSSVHGIFQARVLEWGAIAFSRKASISALLTMPKPLTVWITINCGKF